MPVTLGQLINGVGYLQVEIATIKAFTQVVADDTATAEQKTAAKTEIRNRLKGI